MLILCDLRFLDCLTVMSSEIGLSSVAFPRWFGGLWRVCGGVAVAGSAEQEKSVKWNSLLCNLIVFHTAIDMMEVIRQLVAEGW